MYVFGGELRMIESTIRDNVQNTIARGGGILVEGGRLFLLRSLIADNEVTVASRFGEAEGCTPAAGRW